MKKKLYIKPVLRPIEVKAGELMFSSGVWGSIPSGMSLDHSDSLDEE